jgi:microcystin-dependent protein
MKIKFILLLALSSFFTAFAQTSDKGFSFQGFAIDPDGKALGSTAITVRFSISPSTGTGGNYSETYALTTDPFGVFHANIGKGTKESGSADFKSLDFTKKSTVYKLKVEVKKTNGGIYTTINEADFNAVPYARVAENGVPVGTVVAFAGDKNNVPEGWLLCDGKSVAQSDYPQLYAAIGSAWGASGSSFNVPDLRGMFLRGVNDGATGAYSDPNASGRSASKSGGNTGDKVGAVQTDAFRQHTHTGSGNTNTDGAHYHSDNEYGLADNDDDDGVGQYIGGRGGSYNNDGGNGYIRPGGSEHKHAFSFTSDATGGAESRPVNAGVYYIIKY